MTYNHRNYSVLVLLSLCIVSVSSAKAEEALIAVAANFAAPMQKLVATFEQQTSHKIHLALGSSGKSYAQIVNGAPYHGFFSADQDKPRKLIERGLVLSDHQFTYARGQLALWSLNDSFVQGKETLESFADIKRIALANPKLAPYGFAAQEVLRHLKLEKATRSKWVQGENIAQTFQFVDTASAEVGFVALSQILRNGKLIKGSYWLIPQSYYSPINQDAVLLKTAKDNQAAVAFFEFVQSPDAQALIQEYGYLLIDK